MEFLMHNDMFRDGKFQAHFTNNYISALRNATSAFIKQKVELFEVLTGCETKNRYNVFLTFPNGQTALIFKCKEESNCLARQCLK
jgi:hypothetical protein